VISLGLFIKSIEKIFFNPRPIENREKGNLALPNVASTFAAAT
jgi:hypothetical protein